MELAFILGLVGLGVWLWVQTQRVETLTQRLEALERRLAAEQPLLLDQPLPPDEPLLLDTPVPEACNDAEAAPQGARQALAVVALAAALLAPLFADAVAWPSAALALTVCAVGAAGFAVAALQRWAWLALAAFVGLILWFAAAIAADDTPRALALVAFASLGPTALALRAPLREETKAPVTWAHVRALGPGAALSIGGVLLIWTWLAAASAPDGRIAGPGIIAVLHVALAAYAVRARAAAPAAFAATVAALVAGVVAYQRARFHIAPLGETYLPTALAAAGAVAGLALFARPHRSGRSLTAAAGAFGAAALVALAAFSRPDWHSFAAWGALFGGAAALFAAAWRADAATHGAADRPIELWAAAAAALLLLGIESAFPAETRAVGYAAASLAFAAGLTRRGWRVLKPAALVAAVLSLAYAFGLLAPLTSGGALPWRAAPVALMAAALLFAARAIAAGGAREAADALTHDVARAGAACARAARAAAELAGERLAGHAKRKPPGEPLAVTPAARRGRRRGRR